MKDTRLTYRYLVLMAVAVLMAGCNDTADMPVVEDPVDAAVGFSGGMRKKGVTSRAGADEAEWLDMSYDTWMWSNSGGTDKKPVDFVIHQAAIVDGSPQTASAVYRLKSGETNRLVCVDGQTPLNWQRKTATHTFRAWTDPKGLTMDDAGLASGKVDMTERNLDYEYFVGTKTESLSYAEHGLTVALKFEHLVGKLIIDRVSLIYSDGVESKNMWDRVGAIYFPNMPTAGVFNTGVEGGDMAVTLDDTGAKGIFFSLSDNADYSEYIKSKCIPFYVLPMRFADNDDNDDNDYGVFYVNFYHPHGYTCRYKGNLKDIVNENDPENTLSEIKAGECLTLRLVLKDDVVKGFYAYVENWSDEDLQPIKEAPYPGIFTEWDLVNNVGGGANGVFYLDPNRIDDIIYETVDGKKVVRLYDNLDLSEYKDVVTKIIVPEGYVLDGLGHNLDGIPGLVIKGEVRNLYVNDELCQV